MDSPTLEAPSFIPHSDFQPTMNQAAASPSFIPHDDIAPPKAPVNPWNSPNRQLDSAYDQLASEVERTRSPVVAPTLPDRVYLSSDPGEHDRVELERQRIKNTPEFNGVQYDYGTLAATGNYPGLTTIG